MVACRACGVVRAYVFLLYECASLAFLPHFWAALAIHTLPDFYLTLGLTFFDSLPFAPVFISAISCS